MIFITRDDTLGYGLPVYHVTRKIEEVGADFGDEAYILYVNAGTQEDTELGRLMHDFHCRRAEDMYSEILAERGEGTERDAGRSGSHVQRDG